MSYVSALSESDLSKRLGSWSPKISGGLAGSADGITVRKPGGLARLLTDGQRRGAAFGQQAGHVPLALGDALDLDGDGVHRLFEPLHPLGGLLRHGRGDVARAAPPDVARHGDREREEYEDGPDDRDAGDLAGAQAERLRDLSRR